MNKISSFLRKWVDGWVNGWINGWKVDKVLYKSNWKIALTWTPIAVWISSPIVAFATSNAPLTGFLFLVGMVLCLLSMSHWIYIASKYIMEKEGIGKKTDIVDSRNRGTGG